jgi:death-on-curing protein
LEAGFGEQYLHADVYEMAAANLFYLVMNYPFIDGNKRVGLEAALVFLEINSIAIDASDDELVELVLKTATGSLSKTEIAVFLRSHSQ